VHRATVAAYDLPMHVPHGVDPEELITLFGRDKKAISGVTFVLDGPDGVEPVSGVDHDVLLDALGAVMA